jgi:hypothetical protein
MEAEMSIPFRNEQIITASVPIQSYVSYSVFSKFILFLSDNTCFIIIYFKIF